MAGRPSDDGRTALLAWYEPRRRAYPWRRTRDPYRILVSEVMLQQTQAPRVVPAYRSFVRRFPSIRVLAAASRRDVQIAWGGLGYNRRAIAVSGAARVITRELDGRVPSDIVALQALPGIGPYTAAAVASLAFAVPVAAVDTNVRRIVARMFEGGEDVPASRVHELAEVWLDHDDPGAWNQALMDLGRAVCRPRPRCAVCPLASECRFVAAGASPGPTGRRQEPFEGSRRQVRGAVVQALRARPSASTTQLAATTGLDPAAVSHAVERLAADGLVTVRRGRVRLAE